MVTTLAGSRRRAQPRQHIDHMLGAHPPRGRRTLQRQLHGHQHRLQAGAGHQRQHLSHEPVAAGLAQQRCAQPLQGLGQVGEGRAVAQGTGLSLHQRDVVLPVVAGLALVGEPLVIGDDGLAGDNLYARGIQPRAHPLPCQLAGHRVAVARHRHQAGARNPRRALHIAVEGRRHGHQLTTLMFEHLGHAEGRMLGVANLLPQRAAALGQPGVQFRERAETAFGRLQPDAPTAVLLVLLHHPLFPTRGDIAEVGVEQVVRTHGQEARIDHPAFTLADLVHGRLHVVIDAPARHPAEGGEAARVGVEQHLVALAGIGHQPEGTAGAQFDLRHLQAPVHATDHQRLLAPVKLERLAQCKGERHEGMGRNRLPRPGAPSTDEVGQPRVAARVTGRANLLKQRPGRAPGLARTMGVGLERLLDRLHKRRELGRARRAPVLRLLHLLGAQVLAHRVARQARRPRNLAHRLLLAVVHPPDLANHGHGDHSSHPRCT